MSLNIVWTGSADFVSGSSTPFGTYDSDTTFQTDAPAVAGWVATRLGYPIIDVELGGDNIFACFEEAVSEYTGQSVNGVELNNIFRIADTYGTYTNVGGKTDVKKGSIIIYPGTQSYDLQAMWGDVSESGERIDITRVFYEAIPAIQRFFDPYSVSGQGTLNLIDEFGFGSFSPASQFILMPIYEDLQRMQAIELNDQIRKSAFTFNIVNNKIQVFPSPLKKDKLWFEYIVQSEFVSGSTTVTPGVISDYSNIGYDFANYSTINDVGIQWIRKYTLALSKELLGAIREKYSQVPIPGSEVSLDGAALRSEAQTEKDTLIAQLRENLNEVSRKQRMENEAAISEQQEAIMGRVPLPIYIA